MVQNPFQMGYLGVKTVVAVLQGKPYARVVKTAVVLATPENREEPSIAALLRPAADE